MSLVSLTTSQNSGGHGFKCIVHCFKMCPTGWSSSDILNKFPHKFQFILKWAMLKPKEWHEMSLRNQWTLIFNSVGQELFFHLIEEFFQVDDNLFDFISIRRIEEKFPAVCEIFVNQHYCHCLCAREFNVWYNTIVMSSFKLVEQIEVFIYQNL